MPPPVTVRTIASNAGVSPMTVSRALRGEPNVDPTTAQRIREIADHLGYRRNLLVSTVMSTVRGTKQPLCSHVIAFLTVDSASFPPVQRWASKLYLQGAQKRASQCGFVVEEFVMRPKSAESQNISQILYARNVRGLLIGPLCRSCGHLSLDWKEFSSSAISINLVKPDLNRCSVDIVQAVNLAIRNLKRLGYRRIGFAVPPLHVALSHHRSRAMFLDYQYQLPAEQRVKLVGNWSLAGISSWMREEKPDALIGQGDELLSWLNELNIDVPGDIGYTDISMVKGSNAPFAGVSFDYEHIGAAAVDMVISDLLRNFYGVPPQPVHCYIQGKWQDGPTVCPQPQSRPAAKRKGQTKSTKAVLQGEPFHPLATNVSPARWRQLDLRRSAKYSYRKQKDLSQWANFESLGLPLAPGRHEINGVPFHLIDEKSNAGRGFTLLQNGGHLTLPVRTTCEAAFYLIAAGYVASHAPIAQLVYQWADGQEETHPLIAYYQHPPTADKAEQWLAESGVQDWWPSFPQFQNESAKMFKVAASEQNPVEWRYLYTLQWVNRRPNTVLNQVTIQHTSENDAKLAVFAATLLLPQ
jgi:DNA-binding LacI/PurR family transcriptional regulator